MNEAIEINETPKYILKLGVPVTHRWKDKDGKIQNRKFEVGTELVVIFPFIVYSGGIPHKWADCVTEDGIQLTIGHNRKHQIIRIGGEAKIEFDGVNLSEPVKSFEEAANILPIDIEIE